MSSSLSIEVLFAKKSKSVIAELEEEVDTFLSSNDIDEYTSYSESDKKFYIKVFEDDDPDLNSQILGIIARYDVKRCFSSHYLDYTDDEVFYALDKGQVVTFESEKERRAYFKDSGKPTIESTFYAMAGDESSIFIRLKFMEKDELKQVTGIFTRMLEADDKEAALGVFKSEFNNLWATMDTDSEYDFPNTTNKYSGLSVGDDQFIKDIACVEVKGKHLYLGFISPRAADIVWDRCHDNDQTGKPNLTNNLYMFPEVVSEGVQAKVRVKGRPREYVFGYYDAVHMERVPRLKDNVWQ